jgi:hypothetical protein
MSRKVLIFSPSVIWSDKDSDFYPGISEAIEKLKVQDAYTVIASNHSEPDWFPSIKGDRCQWIQVTGRQSGKWIPGLLADNTDKGLLHSELVIMGACQEDMQMATNSKSLLIRCEWADGVSDMGQYGVGWESTGSLPELVKYLDDQVPWYFESSANDYVVFALTNAGTYGVDSETESAAKRIRSILKDGRSDSRNRLVLHMMSSIYKTDVFSDADVFGYYPSSKSENQGTEVMAGFCRFIRENFKKRLKEPLFIRHKNAPSRHSQHGGNKEDPAVQVQTVHLNPTYRGKIRGRTILVIDDYLTYGVSFGWARALLLAAGAKDVICVALGRFGSQAREYTFAFGNNDPYQPVQHAPYTCKMMSGRLDDRAKLTLKEKFGPGS